MHYSCIRFRYTTQNLLLCRIGRSEWIPRTQRPYEFWMVWPWPIKWKGKTHLSNKRGQLGSLRVESSRWMHFTMELCIGESADTLTKSEILAGSQKNDRCHDCWVCEEIRRNSPVELGSWNPIIYKVLAPSQGSAGFFQSTVSVHPKSNLVFGTGYLSQAHSQ